MMQFHQQLCIYNIIITDTDIQKNIVFAATKKKKKIPHWQIGPLHGSSSIDSAFSRQRLNPIKLAHDPRRPYAWLT